MNVFVPCCGKYSRFPQDGLPKYLRPMNDMRPMISWALDGVRNLVDGKIKIAIRKIDNDRWNAEDVLHAYENCQVMIVDRDTSGPAATVSMMIKHFDPHEPTMFHDCDCGWDSIERSIAGNSVIVAPVDTAIGDKKSKCWVWADSNNKLLKLSEKDTVSDLYLHGAYIFDNPQKFIKYYEQIANCAAEVFCSHVISKLIQDGETFNVIYCVNPADWGSYGKYVDFRRKKKVYIFDLDGTIVQGGAPYGDKTWEDTYPIDGILKKLREIKEAGNHIMIMTARPHGLVYSTLYKYQIPYDQIVHVPNGPRVLINDYASSNPYPSAEAINSVRDSGDWIDKI